MPQSAGSNLIVTVQLTNGSGENAFQISEATELPLNAPASDALESIHLLAEAVFEAYAASQQ